MGVIQRQGLKSGIISYFFIALGMVSNLLIYTKMLEVRELGIISFLLTTGTTFAPFMLLGFHFMFLKNFPKYQNSTASLSRLFSLTLYGPLLISILTSACYFIFRDSIHEYYWIHSSMPSLALDLTLILVVIMPFISIFSFICSSLQRTAVPTLLNSILKAFQPAVVILFYFDYLTFSTTLMSLVVYFVILLITFYIYQQSLLKIKFLINIKNIIQLPKIKSKISYAFYGFAIGLGGALITNIDAFMVSTILGMEQMGLYSWGLNLINAIIIPYSILAGISIPFISKYWEENNMTALNKLYKQSSNALLLVCLSLLYSVALGLDSLFVLIPKGDQYSLAKVIILTLGLGKVIDVATGFNNQIIAFSPKHRSFFWIIGASAVLNITLNLIMIPQYGINGAASATFISLVIFNLTKYLFIKRHFKLSPFNKEFGYIFILASSLFIVFYFLPDFSNPWLNIILKSGGYLSMYLPLVYFLNFSEDFNSLVRKINPFH